MTETIQTLKEDIAILQEKLQKLEEQDPEMLLLRQGKVDIVDYDGKKYLRIEYTDSFADEYSWYVRRIGEDAIRTVRDVNVYSSLEELYQKEVVKQKDDHPYKITDEHGETNPYKQGLNSVEDEKKMEELGFVKNSDGHWTARPLGETAQELEEQVSFVPKEIKELVKEGVKWCEEHPDKNPLDCLKPQTPEQTEQSLKEAFVEAQKTEKWKEIQKLIDEEDNDKNFKNSLDLIKEWGEKNKPPTLKELLWEWWEDIFTVDSDLDADASIDVLVDRIEEFLPKEHDTNDYQWNKCLKMIKSKLR